MEKAITSAHEHSGERPLALVYRGPAGCPGCSEAVAELLQSSHWRFRVQYVGPGEYLKLTPETLQDAALYAQPGGSDELSRAYRQMKTHAHALKTYVASGGRYLGICMGGYLAGKTPGFHLFPGDTDQFIASPGASVKTATDTLVQVYWRGQRRFMYFQDGPFFQLNHGAKDVTVLATYTNGKVAVLVAAYGKGKVGISGPHPEATTAWYKDEQLVNPEGVKMDLGYDLIDTLMDDADDR
ncbi:MAG TPA: BPL-N domain-containing protein [Ktedonobacteraceae bacterium]|jgi:glutamine amidotransferase-like uncharacterized protein